MDGEGVAYDGDWFYVTGSHGCTRKDGGLRLSMFLLARLRPNDDGSAATVQTTSRLTEQLCATPLLQPSFGRALDTGGLNIEGIAAVSGRLLLGLRAPTVVQGNTHSAYIAS